MKLHHLGFISLSLLLASCAEFQAKPVADTDTFPRHQQLLQDKLIELDIAQPIGVFERMAWPELQSKLPQSSREPLYSFSAKNLEIKQALKLFAKAYDLNLLIDKDVVGSIDVEFTRLPFERAMQALLSSLGYYWQYQNQLLHVRSWQTQTFAIDYLRLQRSGRSSSQAQVSSGDSGSSSGGDGDSGDGTQAGSIVIEQENQLDFWRDIEEQLKTLISGEGRLVMNKIAGTVQVSDRHPQVQQIKSYIDNINDSIVRQVDIQVKIFEVTLNDDYSLGVDWSKVLRSGVSSVRNGFSLSNIVSAPVGIGTALTPSVNIDITRFGANGEAKLSAMLSALKEQGEVQIVSQPHIRTLNNQSALIKVGTDRTFFRREQSTDNTSAGSNTTSTDVPQVVTEGIVLSLTPQISKSGWVMMDISPAVTRVSSVSEVKDTNGNTVSSAPNLDIRQSSSLIRAFNGETVVIGGLIQTQEADTQRGVPVLKDVPGVGKLFQGEYQSVVKKELIILLTPRLVGSHNHSSNNASRG